MDPSWLLVANDSVKQNSLLTSCHLLVVGWLRQRLPQHLDDKGIVRQENRGTEYDGHPACNGNLMNALELIASLSPG
jgi:hypothetical protein